jgi:hypothetical protein
LIGSKEDSMTARPAGREVSRAFLIRFALGVVALAAPAAVPLTASGTDPLPPQAATPPEEISTEVPVSPATSGPAGECRVIVLVAAENDVALETISLRDGETSRFEPGEIITVVLPFGLGMSGDVVRSSDLDRSFSVTCEGGLILTTIYDDFGESRTLPDVALADADRYDLRVNVTMGTGVKRVFLIKGYRSIEPAEGPVVDMFAGSVPMSAGDYSITTEVIPRVEESSVTGVAALRVRDGFLLVDGLAEGGGGGPLIVDFGAGGTVVEREFLPDDAAIEPVLAIEHSPEGKRVLPGTMTGAGGDVSGFLGQAVIDRLDIGGIGLDELPVKVIDAMPDMGDEPIVGVLGLDVLKRAGLALLAFSEDGTGRLELMPDRRLGGGGSSPGGAAATDTAGYGTVVPAGTIELPFTMAAKHIFVQGSLGGAPVTFLFDTGARSTVVPLRLAEKAGLAAGSLPTREFRGLDGNPFPASSVRAVGLSLGGVQFDAFDVYAADLPVLKGLGLDEGSALLGVDFVLQFARVDVDFSDSVIRVWGKAP